MRGHLGKNYMVCCLSGSGTCLPGPETLPGQGAGMPPFSFSRAWAWSAFTLALDGTLLSLRLGPPWRKTFPELQTFCGLFSGLFCSV